MTATILPAEVNYPSIEGNEDPFPLYARLREQAPIYRFPGTERFFVSRAGDVRFVARNPELFSSDSRRSVTPFDSFGDSNASVRGIVELDPPQHKPRRDASFRSFTPSRLQAYESMVEDVVAELLAAFADGGSVEIIERFTSPLPMRVMMKLFGFTTSDRPWVKGWSLVETSGSIFLSDEEKEKQAGYAKTAGRRLLEELNDRYENPRDDVLSEIVHRNVERADGKFDPLVIRADASNIFRGGIITVAHAIPMALLLLLENPDQMALVRSEPDRIPRMFEEALRLQSPNQWIPRIAQADTEIDGVAIPKGAYVMISWASANRDKAQFTDAEDFDVTRSDVNRHFGFGDGPHFCLGAPLARLEAKVAFEQLFEKFSDIQLGDGNDGLHVPSAVFRGLRHLHLNLTPAAG